MAELVEEKLKEALEYFAKGNTDAMTMGLMDYLKSIDREKYASFLSIVSDRWYEELPAKFKTK